MTTQQHKIAVVGLGYVGLPLACALARNYRTTGYDLDDERIDEISCGVDRNRSVEAIDLKSDLLSFTTDPSAIGASDIVIVTVPTPVTDDNQPDLGLLKGAAKSVGRELTANTLVIFESTVYPGVTEEFCGPILEKHSGLRLDEDFDLGYSPERVSPGDGAHSLQKIVKVISARNAEALDVMNEIYGSVTEAGIHRAPTIRVAEAAKVIENVQRDVNIALANELAMLFQRMDIDTSDVLDAAGTKWNFINFRPGLVGGHCIPVDPYYLSYAADQLGFDTEIILAGRRTNDRMARYLAGEISRFVRAETDPASPRILFLGIAYKADVPDIRNSQAIKLAEYLIEIGIELDIFDPLIDRERLPANLGERVINEMPSETTYDAIVVAVPHAAFKATHAAEFGKLVDTERAERSFIDITGAFSREQIENSGMAYWSL